MSSGLNGCTPAHSGHTPHEPITMPRSMLFTTPSALTSPRALLDGPERSEGRSTSDRLRRRRAGGNPLHLQEGRSCCSVNLRVGCATAGGVRQGFAEKNRSCSPSGVVKVSQSRGPESENQDTVSGQLSEVSGG